MYGKHTQGLIKTIKINKNKKMWRQNIFLKNLKQIRTKLISRYPNGILLNVTYWSNIWIFKFDFVMPKNGFLPKKLTIVIQSYQE